MTEPRPAGPRPKGGDDACTTSARRSHDGRGTIASPPPEAASGAGLAAVQTLAAWLSPACPVGAFAYSHGLEAAVSAGEIVDISDLYGWIADILSEGAGRNDAILLALAWRAPDDPAPAELAAALQPSAERLLETEKQGAAFALTVSAAWGVAVAEAPYPVAVGRAAAAIGAPLEMTITLYLQAFASNMISAGLRLAPLGQTEGQAALARLLPLCRSLAAAALAAGADDLGGLALRADIMSMTHETQPSRIFRS